ncbi:MULTISPECIES: phosphodiester glycosidase family protein [Clostridium]|uniref:Phosphodiester glycosidase family protein n=1 Tax=Clostridium cibarium TaxID=2762247 RepID=A0ABR8PR04_9CLOT|nr:MULTISPECIES: phosphodiester glycosidase family protein [Clostridium]MBD7910608.1 phosphodiester glycosidase family protein [Clostridium cibarium]
MKKNKDKPIKKMKRINWKSIIGLMVFGLIFTAVTAPIILLYGPFENAKKTFVGSAMATMSHKWMATMFLSQERIDEILGTNKKVEDTTQQDSSLIEIPKKKDDTIVRYDLNDNPKFKGYVLLISDPTRVKVGVSSKLGEKGETVSAIAERYDAVAAINGGYFTDAEGTEKWTSNGGIPTGFLMSEGKVLQNIDSANKGPILAITKEGKLLIGERSVSELLEKKDNDGDNVTEAMSYVTTLVKNGSSCEIEKDEGSSPRTMIGQTKNGTIVLAVLDSKLPGGRICASLKEAQDVMIKYGCYNAVNLDGGKSTTMYLNGEVINNPSYALGERPIASGFIVK